MLWLYVVFCISVHSLETTSQQTILWAQYITLTCVTYFYLASIRFCISASLSLRHNHLFLLKFTIKALNTVFQRTEILSFLNSNSYICAYVFCLVLHMKHIWESQSKNMICSMLSHLKEVTFRCITHFQLSFVMVWVTDGFPFLKESQVCVSDLVLDKYTLCTQWNGIILKLKWPCTCRAKFQALSCAPHVHVHVLLPKV